MHTAQRSAVEFHIMMICAALYMMYSYFVASYFICIAEAIEIEFADRKITRVLTQVEINIDEMQEM